MNILCVGFSVTELEGYVEECQKLFDSHQQEFRMSKSGWGGHTIDTIAYFIEEILFGKDHDLIVLEIFTSHIRALGKERIEFYLDEILSECALRKIPVAFLFLSDATYPKGHDFLCDIAQSYSSELQIPLLNLRAKVESFSEERRQELFIDNVHCSSAGAKFYADELFKFIHCGSFNLAYVRRYQGWVRTLHALALSTVVEQGTVRVLTRNGAPVSFYEIAEGNELDIVLPHPLRLVGVMLTYAPDSGEMHFVNGLTGKLVAVMPYDVHSYYMRSGLFPIDLNLGSRLIIRQTTIPSDEMPLKGEKFSGPKVGRISHLLYRSDAGEQSRVNRMRRKALIGLIMSVKERLKALYVKLLSTSARPPKMK